MPKPMIACLVTIAVLAAAVAVRIAKIPTLEQRAMAAYQSGDYAHAVPLFKQLATTPDVRSNPQKQQIVLAYAVDAELRLNGQAGGGVAPGDSQKLLAQAKTAAGEQAQSGNARIKTGADRTIHALIKPGETREITIKELGNFNYDNSAGSPVPADVLALNGGRVRLRGYMYPLNQTRYITDFALVPSLLSCCFGEPPGVQHVVTCRLPKELAMESLADEVIVEGVLHVEVKRSDDFTSSIFELSVQKVKAVEP